PAYAQICTEAVFGWSDKVTDFPYDPDRARQLIEEAGATGVRVTMITAPGRFANDAETAEAIVGMLNAVGFDVNLNILPFAEYVKAHFAPASEDGAPDISMGI